MSDSRAPRPPRERDDEHLDAELRRAAAADEPPEPPVGLLARIVEDIPRSLPSSRPQPVPALGPRLALAAAFLGILFAGIWATARLMEPGRESTMMAQADSAERDAAAEAERQPKRREESEALRTPEEPAVQTPPVAAAPTAKSSDRAPEDTGRIDEVQKPSRSDLPEQPTTQEEQDDLLEVAVEQEPTTEIEETAPPPPPRAGQPRSQEADQASERRAAATQAFGARDRTGAAEAAGSDPWGELAGILESGAWPDESALAAARRTLDENEDVLAGRTLELLERATAAAVPTEQLRQLRDAEPGGEPPVDELRRLAERMRPATGESGEGDRSGRRADLVRIVDATLRLLARSQ